MYMYNLDSVLKSRNITLLTKVHTGKAIVFWVVVYGCESWTIKKAENQRIDAFELWCWKRLLTVLWTARRSNQNFQITKEINPEYFHWKDWCWSWCSDNLATWCEELSHWKSQWCWERLRAGAEGGNRGWDGWMASPTQWTQVWANSRRWWRTGKPGVLSPWGHRVHGDTTEQLNSSNHCIHGFRTARAAIPRTLGEPKLFC